MNKKQKNNSIIPSELRKKIIKDPKVRVSIAQKSHLAFFGLYLPHHIKYPTADFQREMFAITEDDSMPTAVISAFRNSAKSTIVTLSYPLWAILGKQKKKFILILSQTQDLARQHFNNLKKELENNEPLKADLGPFKEEEEWSANSIVIPKHNARITVASVEKSIRGIRHIASRPDLIICDDVEDISSVRTQQGRDKTYRWLKRDIIPAGDQDTKLIIVGSILHRDSLLVRLKNEIKEKKFRAIYREYPLVNTKGKILWPEKFPNKQAIEKLRSGIGNRFAWLSEYLLRVVDEKSTVIHEKWLCYYQSMPELEKGKTYQPVIGLDLAVSEKDTADLTAIISAKTIKIDGQTKIYILPNPINEKLEFPETIDRIKALVSSLGNQFTVPLYTEQAMLETVLGQQLKGFKVEEVKRAGLDKRTRLMLTTEAIRSGQILFPEKGAEELIEQLLNFGSERYDDLVDAFTVLVQKILEEDNKKEMTPRIIKNSGFYNRKDRDRPVSKGRGRTLNRFINDFLEKEDRDLYDN